MGWTQTFEHHCKSPHAVHVYAYLIYYNVVVKSLTMLTFQYAYHICLVPNLLYSHIYC